MVRLSSIAKALDTPATDYLCYYDRDSDTVVKVTEYEHPAEEEETRREVADTSRYVPILADGNIGRSAMREFAENIEDDGLRGILEEALEWKGSSRFREAVVEAEIEDMWEDFREHYLLAEAREWCEDHDVPARM